MYTRDSDLYSKFLQLMNTVNEYLAYAVHDEDLILSGKLDIVVDQVKHARDAFHSYMRESSDMNSEEVARIIEEALGLMASGHVRDTSNSPQQIRTSNQTQTNNQIDMAFRKIKNIIESEKEQFNPNNNEMMEDAIYAQSIQDDSINFEQSAKKLFDNIIKRINEFDNGSFVCNLSDYRHSDTVASAVIHIRRKNSSNNLFKLTIKAHANGSCTYTLNY